MSSCNCGHQTTWKAWLAQTQSQLIYKENSSSILNDVLSLSASQHFFFVFKNHYIVQELQWYMLISIFSIDLEHLKFSKYGSRILQLKGYSVADPRITATSPHFNLAFVVKNKTWACRYVVLLQRVLGLLCTPVVCIGRVLVIQLVLPPNHNMSCLVQFWTTKRQIKWYGCSITVLYCDFSQPLSSSPSRLILLNLRIFLTGAILTTKSTHPVGPHEPLLHQPEREHKTCICEFFYIFFWFDKNK
jgi:hypothetical protein